MAASAPGSVTEMARAAKLLEQGVAMMTAYHLIRIFIVIPLAPLLHRCFRFIMQRRMSFEAPTGADTQAVKETEVVQNKETPGRR